MNKLRICSIFLVLLLLALPGFQLAETENLDDDVILTDESGSQLPDDVAHEPDPQTETIQIVTTPTEEPPVVSFKATEATWPTPSRALKYGIIGDDVKALQTRLSELGYYTSDITGNYYANTRDAVNAFQTAHGYAITGQTSIALQNLIFSETAKPKYTQKPTAAPAPTPSATTAPTYPGLALSVGSSGANARKIQTRLKELGYYNSNITDYFGTVTQAAVKAFQNNNGLTADGVVGKLTWAKLFDDANVRPSSAAPTPKPSPSSTPVPSKAKYYLTIDVVNQIVTAYSQDAKGDYTIVERRMICSTGTNSHPTQVKQYVLNGAKARWCYFPKWGGHAQYWTRLSSSIAFHSVLYSTPNTMALSTGSYFNLGSQASHGCVRLLVADAKWIYDNVGAGTIVDAIRGKSDPEGTQALKPPPLNYSNMLPQVTPQPTLSPIYNEFAMPPQPFRTLEIGSKGADVYFLQCRLTALGYYLGSITGGYYQGTRDAVKAYQKDNGLSQDGKAGKLTQTHIYKYLLEPTPSPSPTPEPTSTPVPVIPPRNPMEPAPTATPELTPEPTVTPVG